MCEGTARRDSDSGASPGRAGGSCDPHFSSGSLGRSVAAAAFPGVEELEPHWDGAACPQSRTEHVLTLTTSSAYKKPKV